MKEKINTFLGRSSYCKLDKASIFVGLITLPMGEEELIKKEMEAFFYKYREAVKKYFIKKPDPDIFSLFFNPRFYITYSTFDLAVISLMNSFEFGSQTFQSLHPAWPLDVEMGRIDDINSKSNKRVFSHKAILGPLPVFDNKNEKSPQAIELAKDTFLAQKPLPLFALCMVKLNFELSIGGGTDFTRCVIKAIKRHFDKLSGEVWPKECMKLLILESFSWHDLTLLLFSDSFENISMFILSIREMSVADMESILIQQDKKDWNNFEKINNWISSLIKKLPRNEKDSYDFKASHVFLNTTTILGFRYEIYEEGSITDKVAPIRKNENIIPITHWAINPGHMKEAVRLISIDDPQKECIITAGKEGDIIYPKVHPIPVGAYIDKINSIFTARVGDDKANSIKLKGRVYKTQTHIAFEYNKVIKEQYGFFNESKQHFWIARVIDELIKMDIKKIREIHEILRPSFPKVTTSRLLNMITLLNQGIKDNIHFSSFIELQPFIDTTLEIIMNLLKEEGSEEKMSLEKISYEASKFIDAFQIGWRNRFFAGWDLAEIHDFNIEYKGGIQQLVTAFDGIYKGICSYICDSKPIAIVSGHPCMRSTRNFIELNFFDIFRPEFFASRATHEAADNIRSEFFEKNADLGYFIGKDTEYNIYNEKTTLKDLLGDWSDFITVTLFKDIFADLHNFYFTYIKDQDLFLFWYRNIFVSDPVCWRVKKEKPYIRKGILTHFLLRIFFVLYPNINIGKMQNYWLQDEFGLNEKDLNKIYNFVNNILSKNNAISKWEKNLKKYLSKQFNSIFGIENDSLNESSKIKNFLKEGKVYSIKISKAENVRSQFKHVESLFYAYLDLLKDICLDRKKKNCNIILERDEKGDVHLNENRDANILFDKRGGTFIGDFEVMNSYFQTCCSFIMSLWDFSQKIKLFQLQNYNWTGSKK